MHLMHPSGGVHIRLEDFESNMDGSGDSADLGKESQEEQVGRPLLGPIDDDASLGLHLSQEQSINNGPKSHSPEPRGDINNGSKSHSPEPCGDDPIQQLMGVSPIVIPHEEVLI